MINPNKNYEVIGKIVSIERMVSMTIFKVKTKYALLDYTVFGSSEEGLEVGDMVSATIAYSITLNGYFIKTVNPNLKAA